ncbi:MAG: SIR2 family protein, partial [Acidobacteria bacterium]|nr:SIR2 family protein [Acidobacteriota bacterium]
GMPGWTKFLNDLISMGRREGSLDDGEAAKAQEYLAQNRLEDAADVLVSAMSEASCQTKVQSAFRASGQPAPVVEYILNLADGLIITTNYDRLIENAWERTLERQGIRNGVEKLLPVEPEDIRLALSGDVYAVLKLHGDVERRSTVVLTKKRYDEVYENAEFQKFLERFFVTHRPLFVGCSMTEDRILRVMRSVGATGYALLAANSRAQREETMARLRGVVRVIWLAHEDVPPGGDIHDLIIPVLRWLEVRRKIGHVIWDVDTALRAQWRAKMRQYYDSGQFREALEWIKEKWAQWASWELAVEFLRFADMAGDPSAWDFYINEICASLPAERTTVIEHAVNYYSGRLHGQAGRWLSAMALHAANSPKLPPSDAYQVLSRFEEAQLRFRVEDFEEAQRVLEDLYYLLIGTDGERRKFVDILKFLGTIQVLDTIYDAPGRDGVWVDGRNANGAAARRYAADALAMATDYSDGQAWAWTVSAFADEADRMYDEADEKYRRALQVTHDRADCRASTRFHILLYHSAFLRRTGRLEDALHVFEEAAGAMLAPRRAPDDFKLAEQRYLLADARGDTAAAREATAAIVAYGQDAADMYGTTRIERRLREFRKKHVTAP